MRFANLAKFIARKKCKKLLITTTRILVISTTTKLKKEVYIKYRMYFLHSTCIKKVCQAEVCNVKLCIDIL